MTPISISLRILLGVVGFVVPATMRGQTAVRGEVRDSLTGRVFAGATIQLVPVASPWSAGFTAISDSSGRFLIRGVEKGRFTLGFQHPRLDSLGFEAVSRPLDVSGSDQTITSHLALPSAATLHASLCGATSDSSGAVIGRVMDAETGAAAPMTIVLVEWAELRFGANGVERSLQRATGAVGPDGRYVVCGVPSETPVLLRATPRTAATALASGAIEVRLSTATPLLHRDLFVAARVVADTTSALAMADSGAAATTEVKDASAGHPRGRARLVGVVRGAGNAPLANARVRVPDTDVEAVTASDGSFRLSGLPAGTVAVEVIAIGYAPLHSAADFRAGTDVSLQIALTKPVASLDAVRVFSAPQQDRVGFAERRKKGLGYFITADEARMNGALSVPDALLMAPSLRSGGTFGRGACQPVIYFDGVMFDGDLTKMQHDAPFASIGGFEVYSNPADIPPQFGSSGNGLSRGRAPGAAGRERSNQGGCAVVVVWTKGFVP